MIKRTFDIITALLTLIILSPILIIISLIIILDSKGPVFYKQLRVGLHRKNFYLYKFRTMINDASKTGFLTIGARDSRITKAGYYLRKYKIDEIPQLFNILKGDMSFVGPRPETPNYVELYNPEQLQVLSIKPGLTDYASIEYINESELLAQYTNPEQAYIDIIMPAKLKLNLTYINEQNFLNDLKIILKTFSKIIFK